ncbi:MAG: glycoside hydrolase family 2 protein [Planctomycetota bacterium]|jgi:hypothetical protein
MGKAIACAAIVAASAVGQDDSARSTLTTKWGREVTPENAHREYPRPQFVRQHWHNLNGLWEYAIRPKDEARPVQFDGEILVPFPVESALSGVQKRVGADERLWYRRDVTIPAEWVDQRVLLHCGAVDWEATVEVNGIEIGEHRGGYDAFSFDITEALRPGGEQEVVVSVCDPTDTGTQPRGKQVAEPHGIWYTPTTGIWQTVWLEPVPRTHIESIRITTSVDRDEILISARIADARAETVWWAEAYDGSTRVASARGAAGEPLSLIIPDAKRWSPDSPFLYDLRIGIAGGDSAASYAGMREIALGADDDGHVRLMLNGEPLFQYGTLDQGFWPDGLYAAPSDEALRYDLEITRRLGFNMVRKHVKVEPARWYHWCDRLGLLVWQDMPSGDRSIGGNDPDLQRTPESARQFEREFGHVIDALANHPSIVMWVVFNEGWGQFDTGRLVEWTRRRDPTRLVNSASGWADRGVGDVHDVHRYPGPGMPPRETGRAAALGEFGGLGLPIEGHLWQADRNWGYRTYRDREELTGAYLALVEQLPFMIGRGLAAAVYTQTTDVEIEVNGLMTYDRAVLKLDAERLARAHRRLYEPPPRVRTIVATSREQAQMWRWTTSRPPDDWMEPGFDDTTWNEGAGGFGAHDTPGAVVRTEWSGREIWIRRSFDLQGDPARAPRLLIHHDEDAKVYVNGRLVAALSGYTTDYQPVPLREATVLIRGRNVMAIHCRQTGGGQYIDAGLIEVIER